MNDSPGPISLSGWRIDIHSETRHEEMLEASSAELGRITVLDDDTVDYLVRAGFQSAQELADTEVTEVAQLLEIEEAEAQRIIDGADEVVGQLIMEEAKSRVSGGEGESEEE